MSKVEVLSTSEARKQLSDLVNQVKYQQKAIGIGRHGKTEAYLVPAGMIQDYLDKEKKEELSDLDFHEHVKNQRAKHNKSENLLSNKYKNGFKKLAKKYDLKLMILFGSHAKGKVGAMSDVDIAVIPQKEMSWEEEQDLYGDLVGLLGRDDIDVANLKQTNNVLLEYEVFRHGKILYQMDNGELYDHLKIKTWFEYQDFKPYLKLRSGILDRQLAKL